MSLKTNLLTHQTAAFNKLKDIKVGALFMEMGTGKSRTAIELIEYRLLQGKIKRVFWICPVSTKLNLKNEIIKHSDYSVEFIEKYNDETVCICGIESISQSDAIYLKLNEIIKSNPDNMIIIDESHTIKNHQSVRTNRCLPFQKVSAYRLIMTGTPITQGIWDLYCQFYFLHPKILGYNSFYSFAKNHLEYSEKYPGMIKEAHNIEYITSKINPYVYQVTKEECLDLPPKSYSFKYYFLDKEQENIYEEIKETLLQEISYEDFNSYAIFKLLGYLHRVSSGYINKKILIETYDYEKHEYVKVLKNYNYKSNNRAKSVVEELENIDTKNNKVIIWYRYNTDLELLQQEIKQSYVVFNGNLSEKEKEENINKFKTGSINILIANILSGSTGLNLQEANYMIYYNNTFDYAKRVQSEDRIHRLGQNKNCHIIDIVGNCGIDDKIMESISKKESLSKSIRKRINSIKDNKEKIEKFKAEILKEF